MVHHAVRELCAVPGAVTTMGRVSARGPRYLRCRSGRTCMGIPRYVFTTIVLLYLTRRHPQIISPPILRISRRYCPCCLRSSSLKMRMPSLSGLRGSSATRSLGQTWCAGDRIGTGSSHRVNTPLPCSSIYSDSMFGHLLSFTSHWVSAFHLASLCIRIHPSDILALYFHSYLGFTVCMCPYPSFRSWISRVCPHHRDHLRSLLSAYSVIYTYPYVMDANRDTSSYSIHHLQ